MQEHENHEKLSRTERRNKKLLPLNGVFNLITSSVIIAFIEAFTDWVLSKFFECFFNLVTSFFLSYFKRVDNFEISTTKS